MASAHSLSSSSAHESEEHQPDVVAPETVPESSRMITRSMLQSLSQSPPFEVLHQTKKKAASAPSSSMPPPAHMPQGLVASAYMAGGNSGVTLDDLMTKLVEMQTNMNRLQTE